MLALAIPNEILPFGSPLAGLFALTPLYIALIKSKSSGEAFWLCALQGAITHLLSSFWLGNFYGVAAFTLGASDIGTGILEPFLLFSALVQKKLLRAGGAFRDKAVLIRVQDNMVRFVIHRLGMGKINRIFGIPLGNSLNDFVQMASHNADCGHNRRIRNNILVHILLRDFRRRHSPDRKNKLFRAEKGTFQKLPPAIYLLSHNARGRLIS